jgi:Survival motor neuron (SMN) interacting protein 1 (SIP1)
MILRPNVSECVMLHVYEYSMLMVSRSEANEIPHLIVAPKQTGDDSDLSTSDDWKDDSRGYYEDGAYIAAPIAGPQLPGANNVPYNAGTSGTTIEELELSPQEAYTKQLLTLFNVQKKAIQRLATSKSVSSSGTRRHTPGVLRHMIKDGVPTPADLVGLSQSNVFKMLELATNMLKRKKNIDARFSAWLWGLLCKLEDVGTLDCDAVSVIRELGKKMVWIGIGFFNDDTSQVISKLADPKEITVNESGLSEDDELPEGIESDAMDLESEDEPDQALERSHDQDLQRNTSSPILPNLDAHDPDVAEDASSQSYRADELEAARGRLIRTLEDNTDTDMPLLNLTCPDTNTRATLDAIITIIGELYGQRDLLEFRSIWGGENGLWG